MDVKSLEGFVDSVELVSSELSIIKFLIPTKGVPRVSIPYFGPLDLGVYEGCWARLRVYKTKGLVRSTKIVQELSGQVLCDPAAYEMMPFFERTTQPREKVMRLAQVYAELQRSRG